MSTYNADIHIYFPAIIRVSELNVLLPLLYHYHHGIMYIHGNIMGIRKRLVDLVIMKKYIFINH